MATFTQQEIDDAKQRQREGRGTPRDKIILEWRPGPAVPDNFDFSFLTPPSVEGYGEDPSGVGELPFRVPTPKPKNGQGPLEVQEEQKKEERQPKFDAQGRILNMLGLVAPMFLGTGVGALLGGRKGAKTGLQAGAQFSAGVMEGKERRAEGRRADEKSAADLLDKRTAHLRALTESRKTASKDPILAEYLKQLAAAAKNPRVQLEIIKSLPPEYKKHPSIIAFHTGAEALRLIEIRNLGGKTRDEILRMVDADLLTEEEGNIRIQELEDARVSEHKRKEAESAYVLARPASDAEKTSAETLKARADARKDIFNKIVDLKITAAQGLAEFQARVGQMSATDAEDILENWLPFDTKIKLLGDAKTRAAKAMTLQLTAATLIEKLNDQQVIDAMGRLPGAGTRFDAWLFGKDPNRGVPSAVLEVMQLLGMASDEISRLRSGAALTETEQNFYSSLIGTMQTDPKATLQQAGGLLESMNRDLMGLYRAAYIERNGGATLTPEQEKSIPTFQNSYAERWKGLQAILGSEEMVREADVDHTDPATQAEAQRRLDELERRREGR